MKNTNTTEKQETMKLTRHTVANILKYCDDLYPDEKIDQIMTVILAEGEAIVQKARTEIAEEVINDVVKWMRIENDISIIHKDQWDEFLINLQAKYLSPTEEKDTLPCGCPKLDRFAMCINQEHCKER